MENTGSKKTMYWIIGVVVVLLVVGGVGYKLMKQSENVAMAPEHAMTNTPPTAMPVTPTINSGLPNATDSSNTQLQQDQQSIQNSMNQLQQDQTNTTSDTANTAKDTPLQ